MSKSTPIPFHQQLLLDLMRIQTELKIVAESGKFLHPDRARELAVALDETQSKIMKTFNSIEDILKYGGK